MKTSSILLAAALLWPAFGATAQSFAPDSQPAGSYAAAPASPAASRSHSRELVGGGSITYFEAVCSQHPQHEQFAELRQVFEASHATIVFYENPDLGIDSTEAATIRHLGVGGYTRYLAQQHLVPAQRLDDPKGEYAYLRSKVEAAPLKLYYLLREAQRTKNRLGASKALLTKVMQQLLANSDLFLPGTRQAIHSLAELEVAYQAYCPGYGHWQDAPAAWFDDNMPAACVGASLLADINYTAGEHRRLEVYRTLAEQAQQGQRVLVVAAPGHVPAELLTPAAAPVQ